MNRLARVNYIFPLLLSIIILITALLLGGCQKDSDSTGTNDLPETTADRTDAAAEDQQQSIHDVLYSKDGVDITSVSVEDVGDGWFNFMVVFSNNNDSDTEFDTSGFELKTADGTLLPVNVTSLTLGAGKPYTQCAYTLKEGTELSVGDDVYIYYNSQLIDLVQVKEF